MVLPNPTSSASKAPFDSGEWNPKHPILLLVHDSDVSCTRDHYESYRDTEETHS
jgi:hypothetical protein